MWSNSFFRRLDPKTLPTRSYETRDESLSRFGDDWARGGQSAALLVPSAAIRGEWNVLLNPVQRDFSKTLFSEPAPFEFDLRMFR
jgi:RES domain-containing protein